MLNSKVFTILSIVVLSFIIYGILKDRPKVLDVKNDVKEIRSQIIQLKENNQKLAGLAEYFKSQAYKEKEAKLKLSLRKPDEEVVIVKKEEEKESPSFAKVFDSETQTRGASEGEAKSKNLFKRIEDWFSRIISREL